MRLSQVVNSDEGDRLGWKGPAHEDDTRLFSKDIYEFVDCTGIDDSLSHGPLDSHQYYRESPTVRTDIVATLLGVAPMRSSYDAAGNFYRLFPPPAVA